MQIPRKQLKIYEAFGSEILVVIYMENNFSMNEHEINKFSQYSLFIECSLFLKSSLGLFVLIRL